MITIYSIFKDRGIEGLSLRENFSWTFAGNLLFAASQWALTVVIAKLFSPELFGRFSLALSIITPIFTASALQLSHVMVSDGPDQRPFADFFVLRFLSNILALSALLGMGLIGIFPRDLLPLVIILGFGQAIVLTKEVFQGVMRRFERMDVFSISRVLQGFSSLFAAGLVAYITHSLVFLAIAMLAAKLITLVAYDFPKAQTFTQPHQNLLPKKELLTAFSPAKQLPLVLTAFPLGFVSLLVTLHPNIPRYFLAAYFGEAEVGFYSAVASFLAIEEIVVSAMGLSAFRRLSLYYVENKAKYRELLTNLILIGVLIGVPGLIISLFLGSQILTIFFQKAYAGYQDVFVWLMASRLILNIVSFLGYGLTAARQFRVQLWVYGLMTCSLFLACSWLIPAYQEIGAAWSILISAVFTCLASMLFIVQDHRVSRS